MNEALLIGGMAAVTFAIRYPVLALLGRIELPKPVLRALRYVPVAVLMAIIVPAVLIPNGERIWVGIGNNSLIAAMVATLVSWRTKNLLLTIVIGMAALFLWRWLFPA
jgi:branched-subunit amino acid transport protein